MPSTCLHVSRDCSTMSKPHNDSEKKSTNDAAKETKNRYEIMASKLIALGLSKRNLVDAERLKQYRRLNKRLYKKLSLLMQDMNQRVMSQTPSNHIFRWNHETEKYDSLYNSPQECVFLAEKLDSKNLKTFLATKLDKAKYADLDLNKKLYRFIKKGGFPLREDLTRTGGALPHCSTLVYLDNEKKEAYFCGAKGQSTKLEEALYPFVNVMSRSRSIPLDFGVSASCDDLKIVREHILKNLSRLKEEQTHQKKHKHAKKDKKKKSHAKVDKRALEKALKKKEKSRKNVLELAKRVVEDSKKRKSEVALLDAPVVEEVQEPVKRAKIDSLPPSPMCDDSPPTPRIDELPSQPLFPIDINLNFDQSVCGPLPFCEEEDNEDAEMRWFNDVNLSNCIGAM